MGIPQGLVELRRRRAITGAEEFLNLVRSPFGLARLEFAPQPVIRLARGHQDDRVYIQIELAAVVPARYPPGLRVLQVGSILVEIAQADLARFDFIHPMTAVHLDALFEQHALVVEGLHGKDAVFGDIAGIADVGDVLALIGHVLREGDAHEMPVAVENQDALARHRLARGDLQGGQHMRQGIVGAGNRAEIGTPPVAVPVRAGGNDDPVGAVAQYVVGAHFADAEMDLDGLFQLGELDLSVRDHPAPFVQPRQGRDGLPMSAQLFFGFAQVHHVAALSQNARAFHARRAAADHQHGAGLGGLDEFLRMPTATVFLADGHRLGAHDLAALLELGDADIAAYALADVLHPPFRDLGGQKGVCDGGACRADDVQHSGTDQPDHVVGTGEAAVADHGDARSQNRLALLDERRHPAGFAKARDARILAPFRVVADFQRHRIHDSFLAEQLEHAHAILAGLDAFGTV